jgi:hypothetical protein
MARNALMTRCLATLALAAAVANAQIARPPGGAEAPGQTTVQSVPGTGILAGRVVDPAGAPVSHATVALSGNPAAASPQRPAGVDRVVTDAQGRFVFIALPPGSYSLAASKAGWLPGAYGKKHPRGGGARVPIADAGRRVDLSIIMWRTAVIGGRVLADNGDPLVGAEVRAIRQTWAAGRRLPAMPLREKTDDRGVFRFSNLQPGDYIVGVINTVLSEPPTLAGAMRAGGETPRPLLQTQAGIATGAIVLDRATGVAGRDQALYGALTPSMAAPAAGKPWMMYPTAFHPSAPSMGSAEIVTVKAGEVREDVDVRVAFTPTWQVSGVVRDADGAAPWHAVHLIPADSSDLPLFDVSVAVTDMSGAFTFYGVPRGQYVARVVRAPWPSDSGQYLGFTGGTGQLLQVSTIGRPSSGGPPQPSGPLVQSSEAVTVGNEHVSGITLALRPAPRVSGTAEFDGDPPDMTKETIAVFLEPVSGREDQNRYPSFVTAAGRFSAEGVLPGRYFIRAQSTSWSLVGATHQGRDVFDRAVELAADIDGVVLRFTKSRGLVQGAVRAQDPQDLLDAMIVWFPSDPSLWTELGRYSVRMSTAPVREDGSFTLPLPPRGDYLIAALAGEDADNWQSPATMKRIAALAERVTFSGAKVENLSLTLRRLR